MLHIYICKNCDSEFEVEQGVSEVKEDIVCPRCKLSNLAMKKITGKTWFIPKKK